MAIKVTFMMMSTVVNRFSITIKNSIVAVLNIEYNVYGLKDLGNCIMIIYQIEKMVNQILVHIELKKNHFIPANKYKSHKELRNQSYIYMQ